MQIRRGFKFRIYPSIEQVEWLRRCEGSLRFMWNTALAQRIQALDEYIHGRPYCPVKNITQQAEIPDARKYDERLGDVPSSARQGVLRDLDAAWNLWEASMALREWAHDSGYRKAALAALKDKQILELWRACGLEMNEEKIKGLWKPTGLTYMVRERLRAGLRYFYKFHKISPPEHKDDDAAVADGGGGKRRKKKKKKSRGMPRFKRFHDSVGIVLRTVGFVPSRHISIKEGAEIGTIALTGLGIVPIRYHRPVEGVVHTVSVVREGSEWYVAMSCELDIVDPGLSEKGVVAIDRGVAMTLVDSDGRRAFLPSRIKRVSRRIDRRKSRNDHRRRDLPFTAPKSKRWQDEQDMISEDSRHLKRMRKNWLHEQSLYYAEKYGVVIVEHLDIQNMTASAKGTDEEPGCNVSQKSGLNRSILEQGWYTFTQMLAYKLEQRGGVLVEVRAQYSSQTCSRCGHVDAASRHNRGFCCTNCGYEIDADSNAAKVLLQRYKAGEFEVVGGYSFEKKFRTSARRLKRRKKEVVSG
jgi:transposase